MQVQTYKFLAHTFLLAQGNNCGRHVQKTDAENRPEQQERWTWTQKGWASRASSHCQRPQKQATGWWWGSRVCQLLQSASGSGPKVEGSPWRWVIIVCLLCFLLLLLTLYPSLIFNYCPFLKSLHVSNKVENPDVQLLTGTWKHSSGNMLIFSFLFFFFRNCLFRALGDQLEGHSRGHLRLRQETVQYMMSHRQDFEPFVEDDVPFSQHCKNIIQPVMLNN